MTDGAANEILSIRSRRLRPGVCDPGRSSKRRPHIASYRAPVASTCWAHPNGQRRLQLELRSSRKTTMRRTITTRLITRRSATGPKESTPGPSVAGEGPDASSVYRLFRFRQDLRSTCGVSTLNSLWLSRRVELGA